MTCDALPEKVADTLALLESEGNKMLDRMPPSEEEAASDVGVDESVGTEAEGASVVEGVSEADELGRTPERSVLRIPPSELDADDDAGASVVEAGTSELGAGSAELDAGTSELVAGVSLDAGASVVEAGASEDDVEDSPGSSPDRRLVRMPALEEVGVAAELTLSDETEAEVDSVLPVDEADSVGEDTDSVEEDADTVEDAVELDELGGMRVSSMLPRIPVEDVEAEFVVTVFDAVEAVDSELLGDADPEEEEESVADAVVEVGGRRLLRMPPRSN